MTTFPAVLKESVSIESDSKKQKNRTEHSNEFPNHPESGVIGHFGVITLSRGEEVNIREDSNGYE